MPNLVLADNPFFLITGLPLHTLVVHFAVSMIPLSAVALIAIVLVPRWRGAFLWAALIGLVIGTGAAFISKESGEALAAVIGVPKTHSTWGDILPWVSLLLLALAILWAYLWRKSVKPAELPKISLGSGAQLIVGILAIIVSVFAFGLTVLVGHTGAAAVWESRSLDSEAQEDSPQASSSAGASTGGTAAALAVVAKHNTPQDCWSLISGNVYDLTQWINQHPGGPGVIEALCGKDGTSAYNGQHQGSASAESALSALIVKNPGVATSSTAPSSTPAPLAEPSASAAAATGGITAADVAQHNSAKDCWSIVKDNVYDLTQWIPQHPGGAGVIKAMCGIDGTAMYQGQHGGQGRPAAILKSMLVGPLSASGGSGSSAAATAAAAASGSGTYTLADVAKHNTPQDCWSAVSGKVYDLTQWIPQHPGGPGVVEAMCGTDGTATYNGQHQGQDEPQQALAFFEIGTLG